jgi:transcriptional accessory protein Tex/SPT6
MRSPESASYDNDYGGTLWCEHTFPKFGTFVDIGAKQDGLLHKSKIPYATNLKVGDIINVEIPKIEIERGRVSFD